MYLLWDGINVPFAPLLVMKCCYRPYGDAKLHSDNKPGLFSNSSSLDAMILPLPTKINRNIRHATKCNEMT